MARTKVRRAAQFAGSAEAPGDKSVSHRALILGALSEGRCELEHLAPGADVRSTAAALVAMGADLVLVEDRATVIGRGLGSLRQPTAPLDCGNSGTSMRLLAGVVAGAAFPATLTGDESLSRRPMGRILAPLREMGASCAGTQGVKGETAPLRFHGGAPLLGFEHQLPIASAQVKSCLLLAGLFADGVTVVREPQPSRDHTERMLRAYGAPLAIAADGSVAVHRPERALEAPALVQIPGDPSSAAFLLAAALLVPGGTVEVARVDVNPTRTGLLKVLARMGALIERESTGHRAGDPTATLRVLPGSTLVATEVGAEEIPSLVDEVPILAVLATQATGTTVIRGAQELRVKESDRLAQVALGLRAMGATVEELPDGLRIEGPTPLTGAVIDAASDHRIAMSFAVAGLIASGETVIDGAEWADTSFPGFFRLLSALAGGAVEPG